MSLNKIIFNSYSDIFRFDYLYDHPKKIKIICADPSKADSLIKFKSEQIEIEPVTIAHFISSTLRAQNLGSVTRKSELMLRLAVIWKSKFSNFNYNTFLKVFNAFTDYRSFTTELSLIEEALIQDDQDIVQAVRWFYAFLELEGVLDEQKAYEVVTENLTENLVTEEAYLFFGFGHFSVLQLELMAKMSTFSNVYLPVHGDVNTKLKSTDWPYWLNTYGANEIDIRETRERDEENVYTFSSGNLSEALNKRIKDNSHVLIFDKNTSVETFLELNLLPGRFKINHDFFEAQINEWAKINFNREMILENLAKYVKDKNFKGLKVSSLLLETVNAWGELSDLNHELSDFDRKIIIENVRLNQSRLFFLSNDKGAEYYDLNSLVKTEFADNLIICVKKSGPAFSRGLEVFNDEIKKFLVSMGPIRNTDLEKRELMGLMKDLIGRAHTEVLIESDVKEENIFWNEVLGEKNSQGISLEKKETNDHLKKFITHNSKEVGTLSAAKLQSFIDCPRKYYFSYISKFNEADLRFESLSPAELGAIAHDCIALSVNRMKFSQNVIVKKIESMNRRISPPDLAYYISDLTKKCSSISQKLITLKKVEGVTISFEVPLTLPGFRGSLDCVIQDENGSYSILDFKSSSFGIPSIIELKNFTKVQIWTYLLWAVREGYPIKNWGYLNLSNLNESLLFGLEKSSFLDLKVKPFDNLNEVVDNFEKYLIEIEKNIKNESQFDPNPVSTQVCHYCVVNNLCPKKTMN